MSLTRNQFFTLIHQLADILCGKKYLNFVEVGPYQWVLLLEGKSLLLSFKIPFLRFHLISHLPKWEETPFTKKFTTFLNESIVKKVDWLNKDRILMLEFSKNKASHYLIGEFFPKRPNMYLLDENKRILASVHSTENEVYMPPSNPKQSEEPQLDPQITHQMIEQYYKELEQDWEFDHLKKTAHNYLSNKIKRDHKTKSKLVNDLEKYQQWSKLQHEGMLLQSNLFKIKKGMTEVIVEDWENDNLTKSIILDPKLSPQEEVTRRFRQSKKMRSGIPYIENSIQSIDKAMQGLNDHMNQLNQLSCTKEIIQFAKHVGIPLEKYLPPIQQEHIKLPYYEFTTGQGLKIWVGKNATSNDMLTFKHARGSDYWLHVNDFPGSHVVLRVIKNQEPDAESIQDAIQLAIGYSKAKNAGAADICLTQCKHVTRFGKNSPGKVQISKHRNIHAKFDPLRFKAIKDRG